MVARKVPLLLFLSLLSVGGNASRIFLLIISLVIVINVVVIIIVAIRKHWVM